MRRLAGALVALSLSAFVFGPTLDALVCHDDGKIAVAAADLSPHADTPHDGPGGQPDQDQHHPCPHGHCHHGVQYVPAGAPEAPVVQARALQHAPPAPLALATRSPSGLERPPRA